MKQISKLLLITTFFALAVSLVFTGTAGAVYRSDGLVQNLATGEWEVEDPGQCYVRDSATEILGDGIGNDDGICETGEACTATFHFDASGTTRTLCRAINTVTLTQAECTTVDPANPTYAGRWSSSKCTGNTVWNNDYSANSREGCLHCHNGMGVSDATAAFTTNYKHTGHKNMLRKVEAGTPHLGPDGLEYTVDGSGNTFDWLMGTINVAGNDRELLWIYGDWLAPTPSAIYIDPAANKSYSCSKCHATGTSVDSAIVTTKEPAVFLEDKYGPGLGIAKIGSGAGQVKLALGLAGYTSSGYASWDQWGIQCSRCHNSATMPNADLLHTQVDCETAGYVWVDAYHDYCSEPDTERMKWNPDYTGNDHVAMLSEHQYAPTTGPGIARLCGECHRQEVSGQPYTYVGTINGTAWDKGFGDQAQTIIGGLSHGAPSAAVSHNYMNVFLNSPHARFTGTYGDITNIANYDSAFMKAGPDGLDKKGCLGCHNIHDSLVVDGHEPFENECTDCHSAVAPDGFSPQIVVADIYHTGGEGSPLEHLAENPNHACESCHMTDHAYHFMRINTDPAYVTNDNYSVTGPDNAADDAGYASAVWLDLDLACGQCHDGSEPNAPVMDRNALALVAPDMHGGDQSGWTCTSCHTMNISHLQSAGTPGPITSSATCKVCHLASGMRVHTDELIDVTDACGQCHIGGSAPEFTLAQLQAVATGIHNAAPVNYAVSFTLSATGLTVNVDATVDCGGTCPADLAYDWNWGDGEPNGTLDPDTHTYAAGGSKTISLTVSSVIAGGNVGSYSRSVTLANPNGVPVAGASCVFTANTWTLAVTDTSTDDGPDADALDDPIPSLKIVIDWGDGLKKTKATAGQMKEHTYTKVGTFSASLKAIDDKLQTDTTFCAADVTTAYFTIGGTVTKSDGTTPLSSASVQLLKYNRAVAPAKLTSAAGAFSFGNLKPGTYQVKVTKSGYTFPTTNVTVGPSDSVTISAQ